MRSRGGPAARPRRGGTAPLECVGCALARQRSARRALWSPVLAYPVAGLLAACAMPVADMSSQATAVLFFMDSSERSIKPRADRRASVSVRPSEGSNSVACRSAVPAYRSGAQERAGVGGGKECAIGARLPTPWRRLRSGRLRGRRWIRDRATHRGPRPPRQHHNPRTRRRGCSLWKLARWCDGHAGNGRSCRSRRWTPRRHKRCPQRQSKPPATTPVKTVYGPSDVVYARGPRKSTGCYRLTGSLRWHLDPSQALL